jgi:hypothetical protein
MCSLIMFLVYHNNISLLTERDIMLYKLLKKLLIHDLGPSSLFGWSTPILWMKTKSHKTSVVVDVRNFVKRIIIMRFPASDCCSFMMVFLFLHLCSFFMMPQVAIKIKILLRTWGFFSNTFPIVLHRIFLT